MHTVFDMGQNITCTLNIDFCSGKRNKTDLHIFPLSVIMLHSTKRKLAFHLCSLTCVNLIDFVYHNSRVIETKMFQKEPVKQEMMTIK